MEKMTQKDLQKKRVEIKKMIKKLEVDLLLFSPKKMRSKSYGRTKGLAFERFIANELKIIFPEIRRQLEFQVQDAKGVDLQNSGVFKIQCKKYADYVSISTINEAQYNNLLGEMPVLISAGTNKEPMVVMRFEDWIELIKKFVSI